ncbi:ATP-binding cassette domain-containing protein, partial [Bacteroides thetaiotaomicron]|uniref:ATP-binding cassette domain-containing protein n=1 Tax=Bacteroides thetaiotaomicron TaxID=818 RepID=UPI001929F5AF
NASVVYPDGTSTVTALDRATVDARAGQLTAIVGESGSGKSTLLSVAAGLVVPSSGQVIIAGRDATDMNDKQRTALRRD